MCSSLKLFFIRGYDVQYNEKRDALTNVSLVLDSRMTFRKLSFLFQPAAIFSRY